jgi:polyisoprenyl-phosphate glycosyltransferase
LDLNRPFISVVVPIYKEEKNVEPLVRRLDQVFAAIDCDWEVVFAMDPSPDNTETVINGLMEQDYPIRLITFSRRIGKPLSVIAGLDHCASDACVIIDADLQDPPELIADMIQKWREGYKVVIARRSSREGEHPLYIKAAELYYRILEKVSEVNVPRNTGDFRLLDRRVVSEVCRIRERHGFLRGMTAYAGFKTAIIDYDRAPRFEGKTQIPIRGAVNIALDGIIPFSRVPVRAIFVLGAAACFGSFAALLAWFIAGLVTGFGPQWPMILIGLGCLVMLSLSVTSLGIVGEYLVRTYEEARERPLYTVEEIRTAARLDKDLSGTSGCNPRGNFTAECAEIAEKKPSS